VIDHRINETYAKDSRATLNNKLYDAYVKFFRWATDRLQGRDGIICFVSNNSFVDQIAFDGMRKHLLQDFNLIYHLDLHGNVRKNPRLSGTTHNVFGIQVGVGITVAIRASQPAKRGSYYYRVPEFWRKTDKLAFLTKMNSITALDWMKLRPDEKYTWLTEGLHSEFETFLPMGKKEIKEAKETDAKVVFKLYSLGVATNRDAHAYSFDPIQLHKQVDIFIDIYNSTVDRFKRLRGGIDPASLIDAAWSEPLLPHQRQSQYLVS
jgi:predicted helicase